MLLEERVCGALHCVLYGNFAFSCILSSAGNLEGGGRITGMIQVVANKEVHNGSLV